MISSPISMGETLGARIGAVIAAELKRRGWSQGQLAAKAGVSQPVISDLVKGKTANPRSPTLIDIALALDMNVQQLFDLAGPHGAASRITASENGTAALQSQIDRLAKRVAAMELEAERAQESASRLPTVERALAALALGSEDLLEATLAMLGVLSRSEIVKGRDLETLQHLLDQLRSRRGA